MCNHACLSIVRNGDLLKKVPGFCLTLSRPGFFCLLGASLRGRGGGGGEREIIFLILKGDFPFSVKSACQKLIAMATSKSINSNR